MALRSCEQPQAYGRSWWVKRSVVSSPFVRRGKHDKVQAVAAGCEGFLEAHFAGPAGYEFKIVSAQWALK